MKTMKSTLPDVDWSGLHMMRLKSLLRGEAVDLYDARLALMVLAMHVRHRIEDIEHEARTGRTLMRDPVTWHPVTDDDLA